MSSPLVRHISSIDLKAIYEALTPKMVEHFNEDGELQPALLLISMSPEEGEIADIESVPHELTKAMQETSQSKDFMMAVIAGILRSESPLRAALLEAGYSRPDVVAHITEAWQVMGNSATTLNGRAVSEHPDRTEVLLLAMHTVFGTTTHWLPIDAATRKAMAQPYAVDETLRMGGRMQMAEHLWQAHQGPVQ